MADQFILVDTDILIDVSRGITQAIETLEELHSRSYSLNKCSDTYGVDGWL